MLKKPLAAEKPAQGIMLDSDYGRCKTYTVACDCGDPAHSLKVEVSAEDNMGPAIGIYADVSIPWWKETLHTSSIEGDDRFFDFKWWLYTNVNNIVNRAKLIWIALTSNEVKMEAWVIMRQQQALNFVAALQNSMRDVGVAQVEHDKKVAAQKKAKKAKIKEQNPFG